MEENCTSYYVYLVRYGTEWDAVRYIHAYKMPLGVDKRDVLSGKSYEIPQNLILIEKNLVKSYKFISVLSCSSRREFVGELFDLGRKYDVSVAYEREDGMYGIQTVGNFKERMVNTLRRSDGVPAVVPQPLHDYKLMGWERGKSWYDGVDFDRVAPAWTDSDVLQLVTGEKFLCAMMAWYTFWTMSHAGGCKCGAPDLRTLCFAAFSSVLTCIGETEEYYINRIRGRRSSRYVLRNNTVYKVDQAADDEFVLESAEEYEFIVRLFGAAYGAFMATYYPGVPAQLPYKSIG